jgi:hypothetical protein
MPKAEAFTKRYFPNRIIYNRELKVLIIEITRSKTMGEHFALNAKALQKGLDLEDEENWQGYVRFVEPNGQFVGQDTLRNIHYEVRRVPTNDGDHGPYWWIDPDGTSYGPGGSNSPI